MAQRHDKTNNELGLLLGAIVWPDTRAVEPVTGSITLKSGSPTSRTMPEDYDPRPGVPPHSSRRQALMSAQCRSEKLCVDLCHAVVASHACDEVVCSAVALSQCRPQSFRREFDSYSSVTGVRRRWSRSGCRSRPRSNVWVTPGPTSLLKHYAHVLDESAEFAAETLSSQLSAKKAALEAKNPPKRKRSPSIGSQTAANSKRWVM